MNNMYDKKISEDTLKEIIKMLNNCSKYIELSEDLGVNKEYPELKDIRRDINYYDIDSMISYLWGKVDE